MQISPRLSIPLILIVFVALVIPYTARAYPCADGSTATNAFQCFIPKILRSTPAPTPAPAPAPAVTLVPTPKTSNRDYLLDDKAFYENAQACNAKKGWTCTDEEKKWFYDSNRQSITPQASTYNVERDEAYEVAQLQDFELEGVGFLGAKGGVKTKAVPATKAPALIPEGYNAQFNNARPTGETYGVNNKITIDGDMARDYCVNKQKTLDANLDVEQCFVDELQKLNAGQQLGSAPQPSTGSGADCAAKYPNEWDYGRYLQCVTQESFKSSGESAVGSAPAYASPYNNPADTRGFQAYMDNCDKKYGGDIDASNICKEPILREMGIAGPTQSRVPVVDSLQTSEDFYNQLRQNAANATFETRPAVSTAQPCAARAGNGECLDEPTGGLRCYSWIASWLPACENYKVAPVATADSQGGTTYKYESRPIQPESAQGQVTDGYGNVIPNVATIAQEDTGPGPATGWLLNTQNFFSGLLGRWGASEPRTTYEIYDPERAYQDNRFQGIPVGANFEPDWTPILIEQDNAIPYAYPAAGIPPVTGSELPSEYVTAGYEWTGADEDDRRPGQVSAPEDNSYIVNQYPDDQNLDEDGTYLLEDAGASDADNQGFWGDLWDDVQNMWSVDDGASIPPTRQFSTAVPFSGELFERSLAASAFGAFLVNPKK